MGGGGAGSEENKKEIYLMVIWCLDKTYLVYFPETGKREEKEWGLSKQIL